MTQTFRIGIAGLGTVGAGVVKIIQDRADFLADRVGQEIVITHVTAQSKDKDRGVDLSGYQWVDHPVDMADQDVDAVVELIGGSEGVALELSKKALSNGKHLITANKAMLAHHGFELAELAEQNDAALYFEAAIAGCIPVVKAMREGFAANHITGVYGILNGTCNYILTQMRETGRGFEEVLTEAQDLGYAEADPTFDIDGVDAGHKLALLAAMAFGVQPDFKGLRMIGIRSITSQDIEFAQELNLKIKLLGIAQKHEDGSMIQSLEPCLVRSDSPLGAIEDVYNAVFIEGDQVETPLLTGRGAGEGPTASAVMSDIIDIARGSRVKAFGMPAKALKSSAFLSPDEVMARYYLRLTVRDEPGVIADVSAILRDLGISIESMIQRGRDPGQPVAVILMTHKTRYGDILEACKRIGALNSSIEDPCAIRSEGEL